MKWLLGCFTVLLLAACGGNVRPVAMASYDLGNNGGKGSASSGSSASLVSRIPIAALDVQAASWLAGSAMHFRLAYAEPLRRQTYVESRWAAPPAELIEGFLQRRIVFGQPDFSGAGCRLQLVLDEFEQRFDDAQNSHAVLEARALLTPLGGGAMLSKRTFLIHTPAPAADARGGVAAVRVATQALADELGGWLDELSRARPAIVERCRTT